MNNKIYEKKEFMIFKVKEGYIAYNTKKNFQEGHTHLKHFEAAKTAIDLVIKKKIPKSTDGYYLTSLIRLSEDEKQDIIKNINNLLKSGKIEYINQVKSLEKLLIVLNVKVISYKDVFKLKSR